MRNGIDFVPLDVTLDDKFKLIEAEYGVKGFAVIVKLFQKIYGGEGYYCEWTNDIALLFSNSIGVGGNVVSQIVNSALKRGLFDDRLYKRYHILTSRGIQKRYLKAQSRKVRVEIEKAYLLVEVAQIPKNVTILSENVTETDENVTETDLNKTNLNEVNLNEANVDAAAVPQKLIDSYQNNISRNFITAKELDNLEFWCEKVEPDVIDWAIGEAVEHRAPSWSYIKKILENHWGAGRTTLAAVLAASKSYKNGADKTPSVFDDSKTDYDEIERIIQEKMR